MDGIDITPILTNNKSIEKRSTMFWEISSRYKNSGNYGFVTDIRLTPTANQIARNGKWKLLALVGEALEFYNVDEDPYERWNLVNKYPEVTNKLYKELQNWLQEPRQEKPY